MIVLHYVQTGAIEELAQNGRGIKRASLRSGDFLDCLAARSRALCASK